VQPSTPIKLGLGARLDYEDVRLGMVNIFMVNELLEEKLKVEITEFNKKFSLKFAKRIADEFDPKSNKVKLNIDNFNTHHPFALYETVKSKEAKKL
jgi:hypothetical protein